MQVWQDRQKFYGQGKRCAPAPIIQLPGSIGRSHSDVIYAGPKTWAEDQLREKEAKFASRPDKLRAEAQGNASICPRMPSFAEPSFPAPEYGWQHWLSEKPVKDLSAGGKTQGIQVAAYHSCNGDEYDPSKHGWAHPEARKKQEELRGNIGHRSRCSFNEPSFGWSIEKSRDHVGYNGSMARGKIQSTAISMNVPDWFVGVRMVPGPEGGLRGPMFPAVDCEDGKMLYNTRVWEKGPNLSLIEKRRRPYSASVPAASRPSKGARPGTAPTKGRSSKPKASKAERPSSAPTLREKPEKPEYFDHWRGNYERRFHNDIRCKHGSLFCDTHPCHPLWGSRTKSNLQGSGCVVKQQYAPPSEYVGIDPKVPNAG